ncbi:hypothetical protein [Streptomyces sp. H34-S4]|uniref:hypothetical protein n=1 Tax=Streptomyces sp. H34-S4 TaxID=2996463 RepID=UPI00226ED980|nr:hypothetical protein [Streptomyces sp. H34-S4]MCY0935146.1 hypothetical protein [Streptomyces sp. H34-S4]
MGLAQAWSGTAGGTTAGGPGAAWPPERLARHRETVLESVRRLIRPPQSADTP